MDENGSIDISVVDLTYAAFLLPPLIALINQKSWRKEYKGLVFFAVCIVYSTFVVILRGEVNWHDWRNVVIQVFAATTAAYSWFWGPTRLGSRIEDATSVTHPPPPTEGALFDPGPGTEIIDPNRPARDGTTRAVQ